MHWSWRPARPPGAIVPPQPTVATRRPARLARLQKCIPSVWRVALRAARTLAPAHFCPWFGRRVWPPPRCAARLSPSGATRWWPAPAVWWFLSVFKCLCDLRLAMLQTGSVLMCLSCAGPSACLLLHLGAAVAGAGSRWALFLLARPCLCVSVGTRTRECLLWRCREQRISEHSLVLLEACLLVAVVV